MHYPSQDFPGCATCFGGRCREAILKCQGGELNSRPRAYESPALPLSYPGGEEVKEVDIKADQYRFKVNSGYQQRSPKPSSHENWSDTLYFLASGRRG
jgi:hypothetical protein